MNTVCRICGDELLEFPFARTPVAGYRCRTITESLSQPKFDLSFLYCHSCFGVFMKYSRSADLVLDQLYKQHTKTYYDTPEMEKYRNHFISIYTKRHKLNKKSKIIEIGSNNGRMLLMWKKRLGCSVYGVEPSKIFKKEWEINKLRVVNEYFSKKTAFNLKRLGNFDIIYFLHVFEHILDPLAFIKNIAILADEHTRIIIEVPYIKNIIERKRIDNISYSHLNYFCITSLNAIAKQNHMGIESVDYSKRDGGSICCTLKKGIRTNKLLFDSVQKDDILELITEIKLKKILISKMLKSYQRNEVVGYGAGAKGQHLLHLLNLKNYISFVVDDTLGYENQFIPGTTIQIKNASFLKNESIKLVLNLAPTHTEAIKKKIPKNLLFFDII